jgi:hypothetical protein
MVEGVWLDLDDLADADDADISGGKPNCPQPHLCSLYQPSSLAEIIAQGPM